MSERPTPITDAARRYCMGRLHPKEWADYIAKVCTDLERQLAETRDEINEWKTLQGWGGTPEIINAFVKGQQSRIHAAQDIERQLANALAHLRIADEQLALERGALAEAREQRDALAKECEWMRALIETIRDKADLRFNGNRGLLAFSDLKDAALAAVKESTPEP